MNAFIAVGSHSTAPGSDHTTKTLQCASCPLTTQLSGRPRPPLRAAEHAIHCEDGAPTLNHGPLQRVVRANIPYLTPPYFHGRMPPRYRRLYGKTKNEGPGRSDPSAHHRPIRGDVSRRRCLRGLP